MTKQRIDIYDIAKALAIYAVVLCHLVYNHTSTKIFTMAFNMPLFFIISGCFIKPSDDTSIKDIIIKRVKTLIIPYILWGLIYCSFSFKNLCFLAYGTHETLHCAHTLSSLWFLPVMFVGMVMLEVILKYAKHPYVPMVLIPILFTIGFLLPHPNKYGYPLALDVSFVAAAFMCIGKVLRPAIDRLSRSTSLFKILLCAISTGIFLLTFKYSTSSEGCVLMCHANYGNPLIFLGNAILGSFMVITMASVLDLIKQKHFITYIGKNTLGIFLVHKPLVFLARDISTHFGINFNKVIVAVPEAIICLLISVAIVYFVNKYFPYLLGKQQAQTK